MLVLTLLRLKGFRGRSMPDQRASSRGIQIAHDRAIVRASRNGRISWLIMPSILTLSRAVSCQHRFRADQAVCQLNRNDHDDNDPNDKWGLGYDLSESERLCVRRLIPK